MDLVEIEISRDPIPSPKDYLYPALKGLVIAAPTFFIIYFLFTTIQKNTSKQTNVTFPAGAADPSVLDKNYIAEKQGSVTQVTANGFVLLLPDGNQETIVLNKEDKVVQITASGKRQVKISDLKPEVRVSILKTDDSPERLIVF